MAKCHVLLCPNVFISNIDISTPAAYEIPQIPHTHDQFSRNKIIKSMTCSHNESHWWQNHFACSIFRSKNRNTCNNDPTKPMNHHHLLSNLQPIKTQHENAFNSYCKKGPTRMRRNVCVKRVYATQPHHTFDSLMVSRDFFFSLFISNQLKCIKAAIILLSGHHVKP